MQRNRVVYIIYFCMCGLVAIYFFSTAGEGSSAQKKEEEAALTALFGGGGSTTGQGSASTANSAGKSLFQSDFWKSGMPENEEIVEEFDPGDEVEPEILEPASPDNPVNPQTGQPYPDSVMKQFDVLRAKFPNNDIIPRRKTPEEKQAEIEKQKQMSQLQTAILRKEATSEELTAYYAYRKKPLLDRMELLNYVLEEQGDKMSDDIRAQYEKIREMNQKQLQNLEEQEQKMLRQ